MPSVVAKDLQFEIFGLNKGNNGRQCDARVGATCGDLLEIRDHVVVEQIFVDYLRIVAIFMISNCSFALIS